MSQEQTPATPTDTAPGELGSLDAAALAFAKRDEAEASPEAEPEDEPKADDPDAEADPSDSDEDTEPAEELVEAEFEGKTYKVPPELQKALLRQSDYSRKMNEVGTKEKVYTQRVEQAQALIDGATKYAEVMAEEKVIDERIKQFEALNWQQLRSDNPAEYAALAADLQSLRLTKRDVQQRAAQVSTEVEQGKTKVFAEKRDEMVKALEKTLKGWGNELGTALTEYAQSAGMKRETLETLTDPAVVIALDKARKFDALQKSKDELKAKTKDAAPVLRPGAPRKQDAASEAMAHLNKVKTRDAAEAAFLARMR